MRSRRTVLTIGMMAPFLLPHALRAQTQSDQIAMEIKDWIDRNKDEGYFDPFKMPDFQKGSLILAPDDDRVRKAAAFLAAVPKNLTPLKTAKWMMDNRNQGEAMEWPPDVLMDKKPANPIIIAFFTATKTKPIQGDATAWCAAFMNWILRHCGLEGTGSAASASFRNYGQRTTDPKAGDIVCFKKISDPNFGHVGFFNGWVNDDRKAVKVCGGNQRNQLGINTFPVSGSSLTLDSFRTAPGLQA